MTRCHAPPQFQCIIGPPTATGKDRDGGLRLLARVRESFSTVALVWADAGYAGRLITFAARVLAITVQVVRRADDQIGFRLLHRR